MRVQDVMTRDVKTVTPSTAADAAWQLMRQHGIHHLVVRENGQIAGVVSDRDVGGTRGAALRANHAVADLMTESVVTADPAMPVRKAANLMRGRSIGCLVVTSKGRVTGIVTVADLLEILGRGIDRPTTIAKRPPLSHRAPHRKRHQAMGVW